MKTYIKYLTAFIIIAFLAGAFYKNIYIPKTTFKTVGPTRGDIEVTVRGIGNISALNIYSITAQTGGKILEILADDGVWVKKGDLLVVIDGVDLPAQLDVAKANLSKAKSDLIASKSELNNQKAQKGLFEVTYDRYRRLKEQGFASLSEYDKADAELKSANANIALSHSRIDSANAAIVVASKNIDAIKAKIDRLKVYSPVDGLVIAKDAEVAQNVLASTPILKIVDPKTLWVQTRIDERISSQIELEQKATIRLRSQPDHVYVGLVKRIMSMSDAVTLEREIDVAFETIPDPFYINEQAEVKVVVKRLSDVLKIPSNVVVQQHGKLGVWLVQDDHAKFLAIKADAQSDHEIAITNIDANAQIIIPNASKRALSDGMKIHL